MTAEPGRRRRRLDEPGRDGGNRSGCLMLGAVLGVLVGIMFALYGLPPILRAIYGEETIAAGETYEGDGRVIRVVSVDRVTEPELYLVTLAITSNKTWDVGRETFQLEISTQDEWIPAMEADGRAETSFDFVLGEPRELLLQFEAPLRVDARPVELHVTDPRLAFELEGIE